MPRYAQVVLLHPSLVHRDRVFTYTLPDDLGVGAVVRVPFARSRTTGVVVEMLDTPDVERPLAVLGRLGPGLDEATVALCRWVSERWCSTFGEALAAALPERVASEEEPPASDPPPVSSRRPGGWLREWDGAPALARALAEGRHAGFSLRPPPRADRGALIADLAAATAAAGRGVLVLVPEVKIRTGVAEALDAAFGGAVAWLGSDAKARDRYRAWRDLRSGFRRIACGGRAAVFAPVRDLGLIVVDDESHVSFKERRAPRFHARSVAAERARREEATLVAVGVPPSVEVAAAVASGRLAAVEPPRARRRLDRMPVEIVDLSKQPDRLVPAGRTIAAAEAALRRGERVVVLTHRGGDDPARIYARCVRVLQPRRPARLDARSPETAIRAAIAGADLIVATAVVAKDLPASDAGLVAVVGADAALAHPGFRTAEEAFATWWRCARFARAMILETASPSHPAIRALVRFDPAVLLDEEIGRRKELRYPPFGGLARIEMPVATAPAVAAEVQAAGGEVLGPVERGGTAVLAVRAPSRSALEQTLAPLAADWRARGEDTRIDIDPRDVLP